jgi:ABC-2 type transport system ATP-binding protein
MDAFRTKAQLSIKGENSMNSNGLVISTENLSKSFGEVHALKSLDLRVPQKSIFAFLGPNGSGKTTTIKLLLGLLKPTRGGGKIFGADIIRDSVDIRANIGYLPQEARFYEHMTARQTLDYTAKFFYAGPPSEIDQRVNEMIELVGLEGKADRPIKGFSGGERQRLGIALAEVNYPDLLILDEPAANLDPQGRRDVLEVMSRIRKHATIFYCTHILDDVLRVSDQVANVNQGELVTQASIDELLEGKSDLIFSVTLRGDAGDQSVASAYTKVNQQPWVSGIEASQQDGQSTWQVSVTDEAAAKDQLMGLLVANGLKVSNFSRKEQNLEDVFINIIERSQK